MAANHGPFVSYAQCPGTLAQVSRTFEVAVAYHQCTLEAAGSAGPTGDLERLFGGQTNGICGAVSPGMLQLSTGLHTGSVPITVEVLDAEPSLDRTWEEIVEVSFATSGSTVALIGWGDESGDELDLGAPGDFRVRYHARGMDEAVDVDVRRADEPVVDRYLVQFWPAPPAPDAVLRVTSRFAEQQHADARRTTAPADPGARPVDDEIQRFRDVMNGVGTLGPDGMRRVTVWLARRACEIAVIDSADWVVPALDALEAGEPLPEPFTDRQRARAYAIEHPPPGVERDPDGGPAAPTPGERAGNAASAVVTAAEPDPVRSFMETMGQARSTAWQNADALMREVERRFLT